MIHLKGTEYSENPKRTLDLCGSITLLVLLAPIQAAAAIAIMVTDGFPIFFHQRRAGRDGVTFQIHKFRTMKVGTELDSGGFPSPDVVTPVGSLLRRLSIDEFPQLINIIKGDMSFVGPRPSLISQVDRYTERQLRRLTIRPGLTGLAQVRFRNNAPWSRRIEADIEYISRISFGLDAHILLRTFLQILTGRDQVVGQTAEDVDDLAKTPRPGGTLAS